MSKAVQEMGKAETFRGYGPEQGYDFLRQAIVDGDYKPLGVDITIDEVFVSDGAKSDVVISKSYSAKITSLLSQILCTQYT